MRKLLTILLTLVMAICLVNFSNNHIKAEELNSNDTVNLVSGDDFRTKVLAFLSARLDANTITQIEFVNTDLPSSDFVDLSYAQDNSIKGYVDDGTFYITAGDKTIKLNSDCHDMFATQAYETGAFKFAQIEAIDFGPVVDTSSVTSMSHMFYGCSSLESISGLENFNTASVTNMEGMFASCISLTSLDLSKFDSTELLKTKSMFANCWSLNAIEFPSTFTCSKVTDMTRMFSTCLSLKSLDLSDLDTSSVIYADEMFQGCVSLVRIYAKTATTYFGSATNTSKMFWNCTSLTGGNATGYDADHLDKTYARIDVQGTPGYFADKTSLKNSTVSYNETYGKFQTPDGTVINEITYNTSTHAVEMENLVLDSSAEIALQIPDDATSIVIKGKNSIISNYIHDTDPGTALVIKGNTTFTGSGTLNVAALNGNGIYCSNDIKLTINGPTINAYGETLATGVGLYAPQIHVKSGALNVRGTDGLAIGDSISTSPKLTVDGGKITVYGIENAIVEVSPSGNKVGINGLVKGSVLLIDDLTVLNSSNLKVRDTSNAPTVYAYYIDGDPVRYIEITPNTNPSPSKKDESCEKVIGPTWHWNNDKGICEDYGVVGTATR